MTSTTTPSVGPPRHFPFPHSVILPSLSSSLPSLFPSFLLFFFSLRINQVQPLPRLPPVSLSPSSYSFFVVFIFPFVFIGLFFLRLSRFPLIMFFTCLFRSSFLLLRFILPFLFFSCSFHLFVRFYLFFISFSVGISANHVLYLSPPFVFLVAEILTSVLAAKSVPSSCFSCCFHLLTVLSFLLCWCSR